MTQDMFDVTDQVVLISGGSRGIGLEGAHEFLRRGAQVFVTGRDEKSLEQACKNAPKAKHDLDYIVCDVADTESIENCINELQTRAGRLDSLVNCAGVNIRKPAADYTPEEYDFIMNINQRGAFFMAQGAGKLMMEQGRGSIINIDSLSTLSSLVRVTPYSMSKTAMSNMTRALAAEWGESGVRVNGLAPGFILTDLSKKLWENKNMRDWNKSVTPLGRLGKPQDLTGTMVFLASDASAFMTGQLLRVDGGAGCTINWPIDGDFEIELKE